MGFSLTQLFIVTLMVILVVAFWKINAKIGYPGWLAFLVLIPMVKAPLHIIHILYLAFARWPATSK